MLRAPTWLEAGAVAVLVVAIAMRMVGLGHLPGINGDEAWYGGNVFSFLGGTTVAWRTPTHNLVNPFYSGILLAEHALHVPPSFAALRFPALLTGVLAVALAFPLLRRSLGAPAAMVTTLLLASMPTLIAYSRLGWDPSENTLAVLLALGLALQGRLFFSALAFAAALVVHPTNVFCAPILLAVGSVHAWRRVSSLEPSRRRWLLPGLALLLLGVLGGADVASRLGLAANWPVPKLGAVAGRLTSLSGWAELVVLYEQLLSGVTIYRYIVGPMSRLSVGVHDALFGGAALLLLAQGVRRLWQARRSLELALVFGLLASVAALYLVAGTRPLEPNYERYGVFLCAPSCAAAASLLCAIWDGDAVRPVAVALGACALMLVSFQLNYFDVLIATGGHSHRTFRTAAVEPKQAALEAIEARAPGPVVILTEDWWSHWPIEYLAARTPKVTVQRGGADPLAKARSLNVGLTPPAIYAVGFEGGPYQHRFEGQRDATLRETERDPAGKPILYVWQLSVSSGLVARAPHPAH